MIRSYYITFIFLFAASLTANGQWTTSGNHIYNTNSGSVLIGTSSLEGSYGTAKVLQIKSNNSTWLSMIGGTGYSFNLSNSNLGTNLYSWGGPISFWSHPTAGGGARMVIGTDGNVGINTATPPRNLR